MLQIASRRFGVFEVNLRAREVRKHGTHVRLSGHSFEILVMLLEKPGEIVTREELRARLWPADTFVDFEHGLNTAVKKLRATLGDSPESPRYIETLPRVGYRFIAPVAPVDAARVQTEATLTQPSPAHDLRASLSSRLEHREPRSSDEGRRHRFRLLQNRTLTVSLAAVAVLGAVYLSRPPYPPPKVLRIGKLTDSGHVTPNQSLVTDGPRIYYRELINGKRVTRSVSVDGGESATVDQPFPWMDIEDISPNGTSLLVAQFSDVTSDKYMLTPWIIPVVKGSPRQLTKNKGRDFGWSHNGQTFAISRDDGLYVLNPESGQEQLLVPLPGVPFTPRWSPDGRTIRFNLAYENKNEIELWEVDSDGRNPHAVLPAWTSPALEWGGNWTPDAKYFVFHATRAGSTDIWALREFADIFHRFDHRPVQLTTGPLTFVRPIPSRDGSKVFAVGVQSRGELVKYDTKTGQTVPFLGGISADHVHFSTDGQWVAYVSFPERTLWRSKTDGSAKLQLTFPPMRAYSPRWSPDGSRIAFASVAAAGKPVKVALTGRDGGTVEIPSSAKAIGAGPSWSPDGTAVAFSTYTGNDTYGSGDNSGSAANSIEVLNLKTGETKAVKESSGLHFSSWSPDGRYLAATTVRGHRLMLFDWSTQKWSELTNEFVDYPEWSPDSRYIYVNTLMYRNPRVLRFRIPNGKAEEVLHSDGPFIGVWGWWTGPAPDGSLLLLRDISVSDLYALVMQWPR